MGKRLRKSSHFLLIVNLVIVIFLGLAPLLWFKDGSLIKSEDVGLPLNFSEWKSYTYSWFSQRATGTYPIDNFSALFFLFLPAFLQGLGFSILLAQKIQFIFWFLLPGLSLYYLIVSIFGGKHPHPLVILCAVGFYMFNLYLEPVWLGFNIANLSAYTALPLLFGFFINGLRTKKILKYTCLSGLIAPLLSGIGVNPPITYVCLIIFILWAFYSFFLFVLLKKEVTTKRFLTFLTLIFLVITLTNAFWIYPQAMRYLKAADSEQLKAYKQSIQEGYEGIEERSKYTSLLNVLRLQGAWTWYEEHEDDPYVLYSEFYQKNALFLIFSIVPVTCAFLSLLNLRRNRYIPFFIFIAVVGLIFSTGLHPPLSSIYKFFLKIVPGFWLVRSPWYKWSLLTVLGLSVMIGVFLEGLTQRFKKSSFISKVLPLLIFVSVMAYAYPILFGRMFTTKEERTYIPPNRIKIPQYVYEASKWLSQKDDFFRIMVLHYMDRRITDWGYAGYEPVISYFTERPIITPIIEGTFGASYRIPNIGNLLYKWLYINVDKTSENEVEKLKNVELQKSHMIASKVLPLFNIGYLLYERDIRWDFYDRYERPALVHEKLKLQEGVSYERTFGKWEFYSVEKRIPHIYTTKTATLVDGGLAALEPLSRTDFFNYNLVFKEDLSYQTFNLLQKRNVFDTEIFYNHKEMPDKINGTACLLFSTEDSNIFSKKELLSANLKDKLEISFVDSTFCKDTNDPQERFWMKDPDSPLEIKIINKSQKKIQVNLKFPCYSFGIKRGLYIYLNGKLIQKNMLDANKDNEIKIIDLTLKPDENLLTFTTNQESIFYKGFKRGIGFKENFVIYSYEFNADIKIPSKGRFYIYLHPYPVNDIDYLPTSKQIIVNQEVALLKFDNGKIEYRGENPLGFDAGDNLIKFIQTREEDYYLLIASRLPEEVDSELIKVRIASMTPVEYNLEIESQNHKDIFLVFNESFDEGWRAYYLLNDGGYEEVTTHFLVNGYANGWHLSWQKKSGQSIRVMLKYVYQNQFWAGLKISLSTYLICGLVSIFICFSKKKDEREKL